MAVRQYIGARYVPIIMGEWDNTKEYEPLSIVLYQGASYTSRQYVPVGTAITNDEYWALTGDYDAQIIAYRQDVDTINDALPITDFSSASTVKDAIDSVASDMSDLADLLPASDYSAASTVKDAIDSIADLLPASDFDSVNTVKAAIEAAGSNVDELLPASDFDSVNTVKAAIDGVASDVSAVDTKVTAIETTISKLHLLAEHFVVIGDSYSVVGNGISSTGIWWYKFAQNTGMTPHCYAVNGCGYIRGATTFGQQLTQAVNDTSYDHDKVGYVFVFGSLNDCYQSFTITSYDDAVIDVITRAHTEFPNAEIVIIGLNTSSYLFSITGWTTPGGLEIYHTTRALEQHLNTCAVEKSYTRFIPFTRVMCGVEDWFQSNHHPTSTGQSVIANAIKCAISGNGAEFKFNRTLTTNAIFGSGTLALYWNDSKFGWYANTATGAETSSGSGNYAVAWAIPYGLESLFDVAPTNNSIVSIAATKAQPREDMAYGYFTNELPSYITYTPDSSLYIQTYLIQATPNTTNCGVHSV